MTPDDEARRVVEQAREHFFDLEGAQDHLAKAADLITRQQERIEALEAENAALRVGHSA